MHYYPHHIGDYQRDTAHLSVTEHGVYRLLMDHYYATEKPILSDVSALCRIIRATTRIEKDAVATIASQFFITDGNTLRHKRIEAEIAEYEVIKQRNQNNGRLGGRPPKRKPDETQPKPSGLILGNPNETLPRTKNQEPVPPYPQGGERAAKRSPQPSEAVDDETWLAGLEADSAYTGIPIRVELGKMQRWCETNRKQPSRRRFVNWLNRAEKPFLLPGMTNGHQPKHPAYTKERATAGLTPEQIGTF